MSAIADDVPRWDGRPSLGIPAKLRWLLGVVIMAMGLLMLWSSPSAPDVGDGFCPNSSFVDPNDGQHYPDETCTGVPVGASLDAVSGNVTLSTPGETYQNKDLSGCIIINANNITIRNVRITNCGGFGWVINNNNGNTGLVIEDSYLECPGTNGSVSITPGEFIARRIQVTNCENGIWAGTNSTVEDSYVFKMMPYNENDPHVDGIQIAAFGGSNVTIRRNTVLPYNDDTDDFGNSALTAASGGVTNVLLENNLVGAGGYTIDCQDGGGGANTNFDVVDNKFTTMFGASVGAFGPHNQCSSNATWSGNVYFEAGTPVP